MDKSQDQHIYLVNERINDLLRELDRQNIIIANLRQQLQQQDARLHELELLKPKNRQLADY